MSYDKELIAGKLRRWEKYLERFWLPEWKELPDLGLYMDQVVKLLQDYLDYMPPEMKDGQIILELSGARRATITTDELLRAFHQHGVDNDRILFSTK